jgi:hypothetical protein
MSSLRQTLNVVCFASFSTSVVLCFMFEFEAAAIAVVIGGLAALADFLAD